MKGLSHTYICILKAVFNDTFCASLVSQLVENPSAMWEAWVPSLGWEDPLEKGIPSQYSGLENSMDCTVHGVAKNRT